MGGEQEKFDRQWGLVGLGQDSITGIPPPPPYPTYPLGLTLGLGQDSISGIPPPPPPESE
jgi:hypothetical protein